MEAAQLLGRTGLFLGLNRFTRKSFLQDCVPHIAGEWRGSMHTCWTMSHPLAGWQGGDTIRISPCWLPQSLHFSLLTYHVSGIYSNTKKEHWPQQAVTLSESLPLKQHGRRQCQGGRWPRPGLGPVSLPGAALGSRGPPWSQLGPQLRVWPSSLHMLLTAESWEASLPAKAMALPPHPATGQEGCGRPSCSPVTWAWKPRSLAFCLVPRLPPWGGMCVQECMPACGEVSHLCA